MDKTNLTNFQRIFLNEKNLTQIGHRDAQTSASVFEVIHALATTNDTINTIDMHQPNHHHHHSNGNLPSEQTGPASTNLVCNPLLLNIPSYDPPIGNGSCNGNFHSSSTTNSLTEGGFNSSMHINRIFDDDDNTSEHVREKQTHTCEFSHILFQTHDEQLIDEFRHESMDWNQPNICTPTTSQTDLILNLSSTPNNQSQEEIQSKCSPS